MSCNKASMARNLMVYLNKQETRLKYVESKQPEAKDIEAISLLDKEIRDLRSSINSLKMSIKQMNTVSPDDNSTGSAPSASASPVETRRTSIIPNRMIHMNTTNAFLVQADLPNHQKAVIPFVPGLTIGDSLSPVLRKRNIPLPDCRIVAYPTKTDDAPSDLKDDGIAVDLNSYVDDLMGKRIVVVHDPKGEVEIRCRYMKDYYCFLTNKSSPVDLVKRIAELIGLAVHTFKVFSFAQNGDLDPLMDTADLFLMSTIRSKSEVRVLRIKVQSNDSVDDASSKCNRMQNRTRDTSIKMLGASEAPELTSETVALMRQVGISRSTPSLVMSSSDAEESRKQESGNNSFCADFNENDYGRHERSKSVVSMLSSMSSHDSNLGEFNLIDTSFDSSESLLGSNSRRKSVDSKVMPVSTSDPYLLNKFAGGNEESSSKSDWFRRGGGKKKRKSRQFTPPSDFSSTIVPLTGIESSSKTARSSHRKNKSDADLVDVDYSSCKRMPYVDSESLVRSGLTLTLASRHDCTAQELRVKLLSLLVSSERTFFHQLQIILKLFANPLRNKMLSPEDANGIFGPIRKLSQISASFILEFDALLDVEVSLLNQERQFLQLQETDESTGSFNFTPPANYIDIGLLFLEWSSMFSSHLDYCTQHSEALTALTSYRRRDEDLHLFLKRRESAMGRKLSHFLVEPLKRVPNYAMILSSLVDVTPVDSAQFNSLLEALNAMKSLSSSMGDTMLRVNNLLKLARLEAKFTHDSLNILSSVQSGSSSTGSLNYFSLTSKDSIKYMPMYCRDGVCRVCFNGKNYKERCVFILSDTIIVGKPRSFVRQSDTYNLKGRIDLAHAWVSITQSEEECFGEDPTRTFKIGWGHQYCLFSLRTLEEHDIWYNLISHLVYNIRIRQKNSLGLVNVLCESDLLSTSESFITVTVSVMDRAIDVISNVLKLLGIDPDTCNSTYFDLWIADDDIERPLLSKESPLILQNLLVSLRLSAEMQATLDMTTHMSGLLGIDESAIDSVSRKGVGTSAVSLLFLLRSRDRIHTSMNSSYVGGNNNNKISSALGFLSPGSSTKKSGLRHSPFASRIHATLNFRRRKTGEIATNSGDGTNEQDSYAGSDPIGAFFGVPLDMLFTVAAEDSLANAILPLPTAVDALFKKLCIDGPNRKGVFRVSANARMVRELKGSLDSGQVIDLSETNVLVVGAVVKDWLRQLPDPLLTCALYADWIETNGIVDHFKRITALKKLIRKLPPPNIVVLRALIPVLVAIAANACVNEMTAHNVAICVGVSILWSQDLETMLKNEVPPLITFLIENYADIFEDDDTECRADYGISDKEISYVGTMAKQSINLPNINNDNGSESLNQNDVHMGNVPPSRLSNFSNRLQDPVEKLAFNLEQAITDGTFLPTDVHIITNVDGSMSMFSYDVFHAASVPTDTEGIGTPDGVLSSSEHQNINSDNFSDDSVDGGRDDDDDSSDEGTIWGTCV